MDLVLMVVAGPDSERTVVDERAPTIRCSAL